jgi:hypothetical protein
MPIPLDTGGTVNAVLVANTWTEIRVGGAQAREILVGCRSLLDVEFAYGVIEDVTVLTLGLPISGTVSLDPPSSQGGKLAIRSTAGGTVVVAAVQ